VAGGAISAADVAALDVALPAEIECAWFNETTADAALTELATSAGAAWWGDPAGVYRLTPWAAPAGAPVATLTPLRTDSIEITDPVGTGDVAPAYRVTLQYGRNWTAQPDQALGGDKANPGTDTVRAPGGRAALAARAWLATEWRTVQDSDNTVKDAHLNAIELKLTSLIAEEAAAQAFATAQLALYKVARHSAAVTQWLTPALIDLVRPATVVVVREDRWGYDDGRLMRVAGVKNDRYTGKTELLVWG